MIESGWFHLDFGNVRINQKKAREMSLPILWTKPKSLSIVFLS